jgi:hypothetical protein
LLTDLVGRRRRWCAFRIRWSPAKGVWAGSGATPANRLHLHSSWPIFGAEPRSPNRRQSAWSVYKIAKRAVWLGIVEAPDGAAAIETAAAEFKVPANRLLVVKR